MRKEWYFIRHGQTAYNEKGIVQGSGIDSELNEKGIQQALAFYRTYEKVAFDKIIASGLRRTRQTVQAFARKGHNIYRDASINEINWGIYEGKSASVDMKDAYKYMVSEWANGNFDARAENGESIAELGARLSGFIERLKQQDAQKILICTHGRTLRCMMALIKSGDLTKMESNKHSNTCLYKVIYENGKCTVELEDDTSHLSTL